jgi:nucleoside-diphosphate-sugar epimerase
MNKPTIIITGANGFIGECLINYFVAKGWKVKAFVRSIPQNKIMDVEYIRYNLEEQPDIAAFQSADYLVHCAYLRFEKNKMSDSINLNGTKILIDLCRKNNIKPLFLSSFSAHQNAESHYGRSKLDCEKLFDLSKDIVLKPGFVVGKKGMGSELINTIKNNSFFPLIGGGTQPIQTVSIDDLCSVIEKVYVNNLSGLFCVAEQEAISMKQFYQEIAQQLNKKIRFISFPLPLLYLACRLFESLGIKLPVSSESVLGLKHLTKFDTGKDLKKIGITLKNYRESLQSVLK